MSDIKQEGSDVVDTELKKKIISFARSMSCDLDGDIVIYHGQSYFVHVMAGIVRLT